MPPLTFKVQLGHETATSLNELRGRVVGPSPFGKFDTVSC